MFPTEENGEIREELMCENRSAAPRGKAPPLGSCRDLPVYFLIVGQILAGYISFHTVKVDDSPLVVIILHIVDDGAGLQES